MVLVRRSASCPLIVLGGRGCNMYVDLGTTAGTGSSSVAAQEIRGSMISLMHFVGLPPIDALISSYHFLFRILFTFHLESSFCLLPIRPTLLQINSTSKRQTVVRKEAKRSAKDQIRLTRKTRKPAILSAPLASRGEKINRDFDSNILLPSLLLRQLSLCCFGSSHLSSLALRHCYVLSRFSPPNQSFDSTCPSFRKSRERRRRPTSTSMPSLPKSPSRSKIRQFHTGTSRPMLLSML